MDQFYRHETRGADSGYPRDGPVSRSYVSRALRGSSLATTIGSGSFSASQRGPGNSGSAFPGDRYPGAYREADRCGYGAPCRIG